MLSGRASSVQLTFAVIQTMDTVLFGWSPAAPIVMVWPATPVSGVVFRTCMSAAGFAAGAIGPGSDATPAIAGACTGLDSARASPGARRSSAPTRTTPVTPLRLLSMMRFMVVPLLAEVALGDD